MKRFKSALLFALVIAVVSSCVKDEVERTNSYFSDEDVATLSKTLNLDFENGPEDYNVTLPSYTTAGTFGPASFRINRAKAQLGRVLFYDNNLSENKAVSCASCHHQENAFADPIDFSKGLHNENTKRNSYAIGSTASTRQYYDITRPTLFWDSRARTVTKQSEQTLQDAIEMGMDLNQLVNRLNEVDYYKVLFKKAYGTSNIDQTTVLNALEEFVLSFNSQESKFDEAFKQHDGFDAFRTNLKDFSAAEIRGKEIFMNGCASCHGQTFTLAAEPIASNGLDLNYLDKGIGDLDQSPQSYGVFKVPILRNVELTAPYMHDGRFETLEEVVDFYSDGIKDHPNLHSLLKEGNSPKRFNFSADDKAALVAFLKTTTDRKFIAKEKYSDPFK